MAKIGDIQNIPEPNSNVFVSRPRSKTPATETVLSAAKLAHRAFGEGVTKEVGEQITGRIERAIERQHDSFQDEQRLHNALENQTETVGRTEDIAEFQQRVAGLAKAAKSGQINTDELAVRVEMDVRKAINQHPAWRTEILQTAREVTGSFATTLSFLSEQQESRAANAEFTRKLIINKAVELGVPAYLLETDNDKFMKLAVARMDQNARLEMWREEKEILELTNTNTADSQIKGIGLDMQNTLGSLYARLEGDYGIPSNPDLMDNFVNSLSNEQRVDLINRITLMKNEITSVTNTEYNLLTNTQRESFRQPVLDHLDVVISVLNQELPASMLKLSVDMAQDEEMFKALQTTAGRRLYIAGKLFPTTVPPSVLSMMATDAAKLFGENPIDNPILPLSGNELSGVVQDMSIWVDAALAPDAPGDASGIAMQAFAMSTNRLKEVDDLTANNHREYWKIVANPKFADWVNNNRNEVWEQIDSNFLSSVERYLQMNKNALMEDWAPFRDRIAIGATSDGTLFRFEKLEGIEDSVELTSRIDMLNKNHAVHLNTLVRGTTHLRGKKTEDAYRQQRQEIFDVLINLDTNTQKPIQVTRDANGELVLEQPEVLRDFQDYIRNKDR